MKKTIFFALIVLTASSYSEVFSQNKNALGAHFELGYSADLSNTPLSITGLEFFATPTYALGNNANIGIGLGLKVFEDSNKEKIYALPLYARALYKLSVNKVSPFIEGKLGYTYINKDYSGKLTGYYPEYPGTVDINSTRKGGLFFSPSVGLFFPVKNRQNISVSLAYLLDQQSIKSHAVQINKTDKETVTHHSIAIRVGYMF